MQGHAKQPLRIGGFVGGKEAGRLYSVTNMSRPPIIVRSAHTPLIVSNVKRVCFGPKADIKGFLTAKRGPIYLGRDLLKVDGGKRLFAQGGAGSMNAKLGWAVVAAVIAILFSNPSVSQTVADDYPIDSSQASNAFNELADTCNRPDAKIWGIELCGPTLFVDPPTRQIVTNQQAPNLMPFGDIWRGDLSDDVAIANTSVNWNGEKWAMIMWPLPDESAERLSLLVHESWHNIQQELSFAPTSQTIPKHLDSKTGRTFMRMELRALAESLKSGESNFHQHALAAAWFREQRLISSENGRAEERSLELTEGLAEYTGRLLAGHDDLDLFLSERVGAGDKLQSFTRAFAYYTGPAWGVLLDRISPNWRNQLDGSRDLAQLYLRLTNENADRGSHDYQYELVEQQEIERELVDYERQQILIGRFVEGPRLILPQGGGNMSFDPQTVSTLSDFGTVYQTITVSAPWGRIEATNGLLISPDWSLAVVDWQEQEYSRESYGNGWSLTLNDGWRLTTNEDGDVTVEPSED